MISVWFAALVYAVVLSAESVRQHKAFGTTFDFAIYDQLYWLLANGHEPFSTLISRPLLGAHFQPGMVVLTPLYSLGLGIPGILSAQSIGLALTAPALYALARASGATAAIAALPAILWLLCPWVVTVNLFDFRPDPFAPALIVISVLAALQSRYVLFTVTTLLALSLKEDISLTYVMLGVLFALQGKRRLGAALAVGSTAWYFLATRVIESLSDSNEYFGRRFAGDRGDSLADAFAWMVAHPLSTLGQIAESLPDLLRLLVSTGGLALLAPMWMLLSLPTAAHNALSAYEPQHSLRYHYHLGTLTGLFVAAAIGSGRIPSLRPRARAALGVLVSLAVLMAVGSGFTAHRGFRSPKPPLAAELEAALGRIPPDAPVSATPSLLPRLSHRVEVYALPEPFVLVETGGSLTESELSKRAEGVRFVAYREEDVIFSSRPSSPAQALAAVDELLRRHRFVEIERVGNVHFLRRPRQRPS